MEAALTAARWNQDSEPEAAGRFRRRRHAPDHRSIRAGGSSHRTGRCRCSTRCVLPGRILEQKTETAIKAEGVAAIKFEVTDLEDPVEVGKEAVYEIRVTNPGHRQSAPTCSLWPLCAEGTTLHRLERSEPGQSPGSTLIFDPIQQLGVKGEVVYRVRVKSSVAGDMRFRVQLSCDQVRTPVVKEESTSFYKE